jgi:hypothetical protein
MISLELGSAVFIRDEPDELEYLKSRLCPAGYQNFLDMSGWSWELCMVC